MKEQTKVADPQVGIYWGVIRNADDLELIVDSTRLAEAELYGDFLTHPRGHYEMWETWRRLGSLGLARAGLPKLILWTEYETIPRGRVVYNTVDRIFTIYADRRLQQPAFCRTIVDRFGLAQQPNVIASDPHYR